MSIIDKKYIHIPKINQLLSNKIVKKFVSSDKPYFHKKILISKV
jgi:hypothetical protein